MRDASTVLVVDDDEAIRDATGLRLAANGFLVLTAEDGDDGVEMARSQRPDVIVMDVRMPRLDGITALRRLRADNATDRIPVVMLSACPENEHRALDEGAHFYLHKPYSKETLLTAVNAAIETSTKE